MDFAARLRSAAEKKSFNSTSLGVSVGVGRSTMARYWDGSRLPPSDTLISLSETLDVSPTWLIRGFEWTPALLVDASNTDWVEVPEYDLQQMTDDGKGEPIGTTTFRRDWLYVTLNESSDLWIARMLSPAPTLHLPAGTPLFCKDQLPGEPMIEGVHYFFRVNGGIVLAKFTFRGAGLYTGETVATPIDMEREDDQHFVIARVLGSVARPL
ncbi:MAG: helix-turn-helix transcriptional regulator [Sphingomonadales bacterium]|nr:helix-turn-helix transcriptional regulator [Sphingomonadales bacterium]MDE2171368.1 helix-turn-helix transcriptional regulator [Sphingomonadales bacterium]